MLSGHSMLCLLTGDNLGQFTWSTLAVALQPALLGLKPLAVAPPRTEDQASLMLFGLSGFSRQHASSVSVGIQLV